MSQEAIRSVRDNEGGGVPCSPHSSALILASSSLLSGSSFWPSSVGPDAGDKVLKISQLSCAEVATRPGASKLSEMNFL